MPAGVVKQEMLHLGLAGNIFCAIGGTPKVYGEKFTPIFPVNIFYEDKVKLELNPATKENVHTFVEVAKLLHFPWFTNLTDDLV
jgi:hypothetical protein